MTDTPETDQAERESIAAYIEAYGPDAVFPCDGYDHARNLERERDELRAQLREEQQLHTQTLNERDEARQWESQALVARIQRDRVSKTLGEVRDILCNALPNENAPTSFMAATLAKERDEAWVLADRLAALLQRDREGHGGQMVDPECDCCDCKLLKPIDEAIAAWKEARK